MPVDPLASAARAQRAHEHLNIVRLAHGEQALGRWVAIFLGDGSCDQNLYGSKAEAIRFQLHETQCAYLCIDGWPTLGEMRAFLDMTEELYDAGMSLADPNRYINPGAFL